HHLSRAQYDGDTNFAGSKSSALNQIVNGTGTSPTTVSMSPSVNPATRGQSVTFNVTVVGSGNPGGSVVVFDGTQALGIVMLNVSSQGNLTTSNLGAGNHSIAVHYFGDANFGPSDSTAFVQTVTATDTDLLVPPRPAANPRGMVTGPAR